MSFKITYSLTGGRIRVAVYSKRRFILFAVMTLAFLSLGIKKFKLDNEATLRKELKSIAGKVTQKDKKETKR